MEIIRFLLSLVCRCDVVIVYERGHVVKVLVVAVVTEAAGVGGGDEKRVREKLLLPWKS